VEHVLIRRLEHLTARGDRPALGFAVETRDRPGPAHKTGAGPDDEVWVQLHGGLFVARARVKLAWVGEYGRVDEVRDRTRGSAIHEVDAFWQGRPRYGYAAVAELEAERWVDPFWAGPRTYAYEWIVLESDRKRASWLDRRDPPRGGRQLAETFRSWRAAAP
jgi:hypothetical protein